MDTRTSLLDRLRAAFARAREIWIELDYAQQRMFELRTGIARTRRAEEIAWLERLYAL